MDVDEVGGELRVIVRLTGDIITMVRGVEGEGEEEILEGYILTLVFSALVCVRVYLSRDFFHSWNSTYPKGTEKQDSNSNLQQF